MLQITHTELPVRALGAPFDGFRIAHISDFHNDKKWERVAAAVQSERADLVTVTGDIIDKRRRGVSRALALARALLDLAPVCYATGNHESASPEFPAFVRALSEMGVTVLRDAATTLQRGGCGLTVIGLDDTGFAGKAPFDARLAAVRTKLSALLHAGEPAVVLSHRPEYFAAYCAAGPCAVLSGHAHGGQWRLPMGLYAPGQGVFPKYTSGIYADGDTAMYVSRGIGNSAFPLRIHNPPEVAILTLRAK